MRVSAKTNSDSQLPETPRLCIGHFLLWTAVCAVFLGLLQESLFNQASTMSWPAALVMLLTLVLSATNLTGAIVLVYGKICRQRSLAREPGHWLLLVSGVAALSTLGWILFAAFSSDAWVGGIVNFLLLGASVVYSLFSLVMFAIAFRRVTVWRWKVIFLVLILQLLATGINILMLLSGVGGGAGWFLSGEWLPLIGLPIALTLLYAMIRDLLLGERRDWLHWLGSVAHLCSYASLILWAVVWLSEFTF